MSQLASILKTTGSSKKLEKGSKMSIKNMQKYKNDPKNRHFVCHSKNKTQMTE